MSLRRYFGLRRRIAHLPSMASMLLWFVYCLSAPTVAGENKVAETMYRTVLEQVGRVTVEESLEAFREVLKVDRDNALAHYEITKLHMWLDTPMDRQSAQLVGRGDSAGSSQRGLSTDARRVARQAGALAECRTAL